MVESTGLAQIDSVFVIPVLDHYLIYAPLHHLAALVGKLAARRIQQRLAPGRSTDAKGLGEILLTLKSQTEPTPRPKEGRELAPAFLGLIPTRGCNLACEYCGFHSSGEADGVMDLDLVRDVIGWYLDLVSGSGLQTAEVHFFGGEPFCAEEVVDFAFHFARLKAAQVDCTVRFEVATNGILTEDRARWAANSLDSIVLSLDGPADIQDLHRHRKDGRGSFETVVRTAGILSEGTAELSFRVCVTAETVGRMPEIAAWLCHEFCPVAVSFEPVQPSIASGAAGLLPPDPWAFARSFVQAAWILEAHGVDPVYAAADVSARRVSFCPVGQDVPIVSPDGTLAACYMLSRDWEAKGLDLRLGRVEDGTVCLDDGAIEVVRSMNVWNKPGCTGCFCKWHCAGGCHVNHELSDRPGDYDRLCIQTRAITLRSILKEMDRDDQARELFRDSEALEKAVRQASDAMAEVRIPA